MAEEYINSDEQMIDLQKLMESTNIAEKLDEETLDKIGQTVIKEFDIDEKSRAEWEKINEEAIKLATQVVENKSEPFEDAANIKYPILSLAAVQFGSRAFSQIFPNLLLPLFVVMGGLKDAHV